MHGSWHLGQLQIGLSRPIKLAQCRSAKITLEEAIPVQMDGEPWRQPPATLEVSLRGQVGSHHHSQMCHAVCVDQGQVLWQDLPVCSMGWLCRRWTGRAPDASRQSLSCRTLSFDNTSAGTWWTAAALLLRDCER